jgi:hypothetical protein
MNRRGFFSRAGILLAAVAISPSIFLAATKNTGVPKVHLILTSTPIVAGPRRLKTIWTCEMEQDLQYMYDLRSDEELHRLLPK